jgi:hypothetical protein
LKTRRLTVATVALFAAVGLAGAGCGKTGSSTNVAASTLPSPTLAPKDALLASTKTLASTSHKFTIKSSGLTGQGAADPAAKAVALTMSGTQSGVSVKMDFVAINTDVYMKIDFGALNRQVGIDPAKYMHLDATKLGSNSNLPVQPGGDPVEMNGILAGLVDVTTTDGRNFTGTLDLTKATGSSTLISAAVAKVGDKAKAVPFTAVLDDNGRMTDLKIDGSGIDPALGIEVSFSDFGTAADVTKPDPSQVVEAPDALAQMFKK